MSCAKPDLPILKTIGGSFFAKFLASLGLFINDVIIFGDYPRFSPQSTLYTLNT